MEPEENPIEKIREKLDEHETADEKREREAREAAEHEAAAHEKGGEELRAIDSKVTKLCEDIESWKTQTFSAIEKMGEALTQSTREALEAARETPQPVLPQNPPPVEPSVEPRNPPAPSVEDDRPEAKTAQKPSTKKLRFL